MESPVSRETDRIIDAVVGVLIAAAFAYSWPY